LTTSWTRKVTKTETSSEVKVRLAEMVSPMPWMVRYQRRRAV
jgi:hypothetical protein